jgi:hypothetical protein
MAALESVSIVVPLYAVRGGDGLFMRDADVAAVPRAPKGPSVGSRAEADATVAGAFTVRAEESVDVGTWQQESGAPVIDEDGRELVVVGIARCVIGFRDPT